MHFIGSKLRKIDVALAVSATLDRVASFMNRPVAESRIFLHAAGKVRRFCLVHFRKRYVRKQLAAREGDCLQCGHCCNMLFTCPLLMNKGGCIAYGVCRPSSCRVFPIDQRDIDEVGKCGGRCGYRFGTRDEQKTRQEKSKWYTKSLLG